METITHIYSTAAANPHTWPFVFGLTGLWLSSVAVVTGWGLIKLIKWGK